MFYLNEKVYWDKVYGCWLGKNAGGTLGQPLEDRFGKDEMFNVSWYPRLTEGGEPNDDLEIQLVWLQALQERGPLLTNRDLAEYWLDCISYNFDEYGLSKTNLQKGLLPPISGWYNNYFKDCMGSPIRSEIWACIAPGDPKIAVYYAYEDAIVDHGGGESVYGEIFNAAIESAAFILNDKIKLIELGLKFIPKESLTYQAISDVLELYKEGTSWKDTRNKIKDKYYNPIAQYSPINLGFQTIGFLYGEDFGDAICKAVNCGWDTDCTGATVGAIFGIMLGGSQLPKKWIEPLGNEISTNVVTGGLKNLHAPTNLKQLTDQVVAMGKRILKFWNSDFSIVSDGERTEKEDSYFEEKLRKVNIHSFYKAPNRIDFDLRTIRTSLIYENTASVVGGENTTNFALDIYNPRPESVEVEINMELPDKWILTPSCPIKKGINPSSNLEMKFSLRTPAESIRVSNRGTIILDVKNRPSTLRVPITFAGGFRWLVSPLFEDKTLEDDCGIDENALFKMKPSGWKEIWRTEYDLKVEQFFEKKKGILYLLTFIDSEVEQNVILGIPNNNRMMLWLNGEKIHKTECVISLRPNESGDGSNYVITKLKKGFNQILIKLERGDSEVLAHFVPSKPDENHPIAHGHALLNVSFTLFPWEDV